MISKAPVFAVVGLILAAIALVALALSGCHQQQSNNGYPVVVHSYSPGSRRPVIVRPRRVVTHVHVHVSAARPTVSLSKPLGVSWR